MPYLIAAGLLAGTLTATIVVAYRAGRARAAWHDVHAAKHAVRDTRRIAWAHTARLAAGMAVVLIGLLAAGFQLVP
ncbi:hypothetical protein [Actinoplanes sp. DH11]|uniref:hypothetical protein n=1 Tax=Actinoplanes sp. DH11 TaxID=2857011 RepID=UPI001E62B0F1|nr:hypothetical protein [Actinoplanes sp. DH11]